MSSMTVKLTWDEDLGPNWMNKDNLALLLFNKFATRSDLLQVTVLGHTEWHGKVPFETPKSLRKIGLRMLQKIAVDKQGEIDRAGLETGKYNSAYFAMPGYEIKDWLGVFG